MWKFEDFSVARILREITFGDSRSSKNVFLAILWALNFVQARSEQGSEISKNCHKNLCKFPNILPPGNKSGRQIWAFFVGFSYAH